MRALCLASVLFHVSGCATMAADSDREAAGATATAAVEDDPPGYLVWFDDGMWHLRAVARARAHRFQGSVVGLHGSVAELVLTDPSLRDRAALVGDAIQFDFEVLAGEQGFDARVAGGCARFDLYFDGKRRLERVRLGSAAQHPAHLPVERCPP